MTRDARATSAPDPHPPVPPDDRRRLGPDFWRLWTTSTAANLGDGVRRVAFSLLAVTLTRDPVLVSAVAAATTLPWLVVGPVAGLAVDRLDRLRLLWTVNAARVVVVTALVVALATGHAGIELLITAALLLGVGEAFVDDAAVALVPRTVAPAQLERANSRLYGAQVITGQFIGQGVTGALFALAVVAPFVLDAGALLVATVTAVALSAGSPASAATAPRSGSHGAPPSLLDTAGRACTDIAEGVAWLFSRPLLRGLWLVLAALGFASGAFWGVIALYADEVLHLGPTGFGLVLAVGAAGSLLGSQVAPALSARLGVAGAMYCGVALVVASLAGLALTRSGVVAAVLMVTNGVGVLLWNVLGVSLCQRVVPDGLLERVSSAFSVAAVGSATVGALAGGVIADAVGLPAVFWGSAAVVGVPALLVAPSLTSRAPDVQEP